MVAQAHAGGPAVGVADDAVQRPGDRAAPGGKVWWLVTAQLPGWPLTGLAAVVPSLKLFGAAGEGGECGVRVSECRIVRSVAAQMFPAQSQAQLAWKAVTGAVVEDGAGEFAVI